MEQTISLFHIDNAANNSFLFHHGDLIYNSLNSLFLPMQCVIKKNNSHKTCNKNKGRSLEKKCSLSGIARMRGWECPVQIYWLIFKKYNLG